MKKHHPPLPLILCLSLAISVQLGCNEHVTEHMMKMGNFQKVVLNPQNGDILKFDGFKANFVGENPCEKTGPDLSECKLKIPGQYGYYQFNCSSSGGPCPDPEIEVGSTTLDPMRPTMIAARAPIPDRTVAIPCQGGTIALYEANTSVPAGEVIAWVRNGSGDQLLTKWSVAPNDFCEDTATPITETHSYCKVKSTPGGPYTYRVTSTATPPGCSPSGPGTVTITAR